MNILAIIFLALSAVVAVIITILTKRETNWAGDEHVHGWRASIANGALGGGVCAALVVVVWLFVAFPISTYNRNTCKSEAKGYGLDYDWSIRNDCRIELPTGQLVPSNKIRITSDGEIVAGEN